MKKILSLFLSVLLIISVFSGCTTNNATEPSTESFSVNGNIVRASAPAQGMTVGFHTAKQAKYLAGDYSKVKSYAKGTKELSKPEAVCFTWASSSGATEYTLNISENSDMTDCITYTSETESLDVYNLKIATTYYWTVSANGETSAAAEFKTSDTGPRNINVDGVTNVRDLGGWETPDGRTKQGLIYRCGRLNKSSVTTAEIEITEDGIKTMRDDLGIKTEIDLRKVDNNEIGGITQSPLGADINYVSCPMEWKGDMLDENIEEIKKVFAVLADESNYPVIFHCNIGTDRTGMIAFLVNALLGVSEEDLFTDYLFSNFGKIGSSRTIDKNMMPSGYYDKVKNSQGNTLSEKTYNCLVGIGVPAGQLDAVIDILG